MQYLLVCLGSFSDNPGQSAHFGVGNILVNSFKLARSSSELYDSSSSCLELLHFLLAFLEKHHSSRHSSVSSPSTQFCWAEGEISLLSSARKRTVKSNTVVTMFDMVR